MNKLGGGDDSEDQNINQGESAEIMKVGGNSKFSEMDIRIVQALLESNGKLPEGENGKLILTNMDEFLGVVLDLTLGFLKMNCESIGGDDIGFRKRYENTQNHVFSVFSSICVRYLDSIQYFKKYVYYNAEFPLFANQLALKIIPTLSSLSEEGFFKYLDPINNSCKTIVEVISLFDFLGSILQMNAQHKKDAKLQAMVKKYLKILHNAADQRFPIVQFNTLNDSYNNPKEMRSAFPRETEKYFHDRLLSKRLTVSEKVGNIFTRASKDEWLHYDLDQFDPIIRISSDYAISLDMTNSMPVYGHSIEGSSPGERFDHSKLFENYDFEMNISQADLSILIKYIHRPNILMHIEYFFGLRFSEYPFSIQPPFLQFLAYATLEDFARLREFLAGASNIDDKYYRLRLFLATVEKPNPKKPKQLSISEIILGLESKLVEAYSQNDTENGEQKGKNMARLIFKKYSEVMDIIEESALKIQTSLFSENTEVKFNKTEFAKNLLGRANEVILRGFDMEVNTQNPENIERLFGQCRVDLIQFGSLFRTINIHVRGDNLDEILKFYNVTKRTVKGIDLWKNEENAVKGLYQRNYQNRSDFGQVMQLVNSEFAEDSKDENTEYTFFNYATGEDIENSESKEQSTPILVIKFTKKDDGRTIYAGGFNSEPMLLKSRFGAFAFGALLQQYNDKVVTGKVAEGSKELLGFYKEFGFEGDGILHGEEGAFRYYDIVRPARNV